MEGLGGSCTLLPSVSKKPLLPRGSGYFPLFLRPGARKETERKMCVQRVDFALGLISRAVGSGLSAGAGLVEGQNGAYLSDCHEIGWKAACGSGGEPSAPALRELPCRQVRRQGRDHLD